MSEEIKQVLPKVARVKDQPKILESEAYLKCTNAQKSNKKKSGAIFGVAVGLTTLFFILVCIFGPLIAIEDTRTTFIILTCVFAALLLGGIGWLIPSIVRWVKYLKGNKTRAMIYKDSIIVYYRELSSREIYVDNKLINKVNVGDSIEAEAKGLTIKSSDKVIEIKSHGKVETFRW